MNKGKSKYSGKHRGCCVQCSCVLAIKTPEEEYRQEKIYQFNINEAIVKRIK